MFSRSERASHLKENTAARPVEEDENTDDQQPILTLADGYKMIIAPVAHEFDKPEIIIVPDRLFFKVPFAALKDERGRCLSVFQDPHCSLIDDSQAHSGQSIRLSQPDWCTDSGRP